MASTGNVLPGSGASVARGSGLDWTNPGNITADDGSDATCAAPDSNGSDYLVAKGFDFSAIPDGATIDGILVRVEASEHSGGTEPLRAQLQDDAGSLFGTEKTTSNEGSLSGTAKSVYTYGSAADKWGATLSAAIVKDPDFGVRFYFSTTHDVRIDYVTMDVTYTPLPETTDILPGAGAAARAVATKIAKSNALPAAGSSSVVSARKIAVVTVLAAAVGAAGDVAATKRAATDVTAGAGAAAQVDIPEAATLTDALAGAGAGVTLSVSKIVGTNVLAAAGAAPSGRAQRRYKDDFNDASIAAWWTQEQGTWVESGGTISASRASGECRLYHPDQAAQNALPVWYQLVTLDSSPAANQFIGLWVVEAGNDEIQWGVRRNAGNTAWYLTAYTKVAVGHGGGNTTSATVAYDAALHKFFRVRYESSDDTFRYDTSADGRSWTQHYSHARIQSSTPGWSITTSARWRLWLATTASAVNATFDNFNVDIALRDLHGAAGAGATISAKKIARTNLLAAAGAGGEVDAEPGVVAVDAYAGAGAAAEISAKKIARTDVLAPAGGAADISARKVAATDLLAPAGAAADVDAQAGEVSTDALATAGAAAVISAKKVVATDVLAAAGAAAAPLTTTIRHATHPQFADDFNDGSIHARWQNTTGMVESGGDFYRTATAPFSGSPYVEEPFGFARLADRLFSARVYQPTGTPAEDDSSSIWAVEPVSGCEVWFGPQYSVTYGWTLTFWRLGGGGGSAGYMDATATAYDPNVHKWFAIRWEPGDSTFRALTSADGKTWTQIYSLDAGTRWPSEVNKATRFSLLYGTTGSGSKTVRFDDFQTRTTPFSGPGAGAAAVISAGKRQTTNVLAAAGAAAQVDAQPGEVSTDTRAPAGAAADVQVTKRAHADAVAPAGAVAEITATKLRTTTDLSSPAGAAAVLGTGKLRATDVLAPVGAATSLSAGRGEVSTDALAPAGAGAEIHATKRAQAAIAAAAGAAAEMRTAGRRATDAAAAAGAAATLDVSRIIPATDVLAPAGAAATLETAKRASTDVLAPAGAAGTIATSKRVARDVVAPAGAAAELWLGGGETLYAGAGAAAVISVTKIVGTNVLAPAGGAATVRTGPLRVTESVLQQVAKGETVRATESVLQQVAKGETVRVTESVLQQVAKGETVRVTESVLQAVYGPQDALRVTESVLQIVEQGGISAVWSIQNVTDVSADIIVIGDPSYLEVRYQVSLVPTFASTILDVSSASFYQAITGLSPSTPYYVRIRIRMSTGWLGWEPTQSFTTLATPPPPPPSTRALPFVSPKYGEPISGTAYRVEWPWSAGASSVDLYISSNLGGAWILLAAGLTGTTYLFDTTLYADGIDYLFRLDFNNGQSFTHFGFKIDNSSGTTTWIPYTGVPGAGSGAHRILWDTSVPWYPLAWDGVAAVVNQYSLQNPTVACPPQVEWVDECDVTSYVRAGTMAAWWPVGSMSWAQRYLTVEGRLSGVAANVSGTRAAANQRGIAAGIRMGQIMPGLPYVSDGINSNFFDFVVAVQDTPTTDVYFSHQLAGWDEANDPVFASGDKSGAPFSGLIPVRLRVERVDATHVNIKAGMCGWEGTPYWLHELNNVLFAIPDPPTDPSECPNCGWVSGRWYGATWGIEAFTDGQDLGVTRLSGAAVVCGCEPVRPCPVGPPYALFGRRYDAVTLENGDAVLYGDTGLQDQGIDYDSRILTAEIFPAGAGGEATFYALRVSLETVCPQTFLVTPILNGRRLPTITVNVPGRALIDEPDVWLVEIPLVEKYWVGGVEKLRYGVRGTYLAFEFQVPIVSLGDETFAFLEADVEYDTVRERFVGPLFYEDPLLQPSSCATEPHAYFGQLGGNGVGVEGGGDDFGVAYPVRLYAHAVMPAGADGEAIFPTLYLLTTRNNTSAVTLTVLPYLNTYALLPKSVTLPAVTDPVTDVHEIPIPIPYGTVVENFLYSPRGVRFAFRIDVSGPFDGEIIFECGEIEVGVVRESKPAIPV